MEIKTKKIYNVIFTLICAAIIFIFVFFAVNSREPDMILQNGEITVPQKTEIPSVSSEQITTDEGPLFEYTEARITFTGAGDNVVHQCLWMDAAKRALPGGRAYNFKPMFFDVADMIASADIAFINQETLMAGTGFELSGYPTFNSPQELGYDLAELGFDVINIANNHMADKGERGLVQTIEFWRSLDITLIGAYLDSGELDNIGVIERGGIKTAFLAYTYGTNGIALSKNAKAVIPYINEELIISQIEKAKEISDAVIVSMHWGNENVSEPTAEQKKIAQLIADCGAVAIIGHHPHVLQPIEWIEGKNGGRTLCVYSLGNIASGMDHPKNMVGGFINFDIVMRQNTVTAENPVFTPTIYHYGQNWLGGYIYKLEDYTPELAKSHGTNTLHGIFRTVDELRFYVTDNISGEFLKGGGGQQ